MSDFNHSSNFDICLLNNHYTKRGYTRARAQEVFGISEKLKKGGSVPSLCRFGFSVLLLGDVPLHEPTQEL